jgi:probable phosphoglycerate mutase
MQLEGGSATLVLMRHGETAWNREKRIMGDLDIPLSEEGRAQCADAAALLEDFGIRRIVTSPLARAAESAGIIAARLGVAVTSDERLVEVRFGQWQGLTYEEVATDPLYHVFASDPVLNRTPGGETVACVQARGLEGLSSLGVGECVLFVTHGDIIRTLLCHFLATPLCEYRRIRADNCGLSAITISSGKPEVKFLNVLADQRRACSPTHWSGRP